jgi:hypothetical protein
MSNQDDRGSRDGRGAINNIQACLRGKLAAVDPDIQTSKEVVHPVTEDSAEDAANNRAEVEETLTSVSDHHRVQSMQHTDLLPVEMISCAQEDGGGRVDANDPKPTSACMLYGP